MPPLRGLAIDALDLEFVGYPVGQPFSGHGILGPPLVKACDLVLSSFLDEPEPDPELGTKHLRIPIGGRFRRRTSDGKVKVEPGRMPTVSPPTIGRRDAIFVDGPLYDRC